MSGVFGIYSQDGADVAGSCYYGLYALHHRGQESCGIVVNHEGLLKSHKGLGLVNEVFTADTLASLGQGEIAIGHTRYGTSGINRMQNSQPLVVNHVKGLMTLAQSGVLTNAYELREELELAGSIFHTSSDAELIAYAIIRERLRSSSIEEAVRKSMNVLQGSYSMVIMSSTKLIGVRDPHGYHPLCIGKMGENTWVITGETCALDAVGATFVRDVEPGEVVIVDKNGLRSDKTYMNTQKRGLCIFEYIYTSRPDSVVDGTSVHMARQQAGAFLAMEHPVDADVVIGVPDSGLDAAMGYAKQSGIPYGMGFIRNKYIARTFIQPSQSDREHKVRIKLNPVASVVAGKRVVLVDDSIVRGTTCAQIIKLLRDAGATEVHMRSSAPPFRFPCYFGTDIDSCEKLIAHNHSVEEIRQIIGVDSLGYLSCEHAEQIAVNTPAGFCTGCFTGVYPSDIPKHPAKRSKFERSVMEGNV